MIKSHTVRTKSHDYNVYIKRNLLNNLQDYIDDKYKRIFIVSDLKLKSKAKQIFSNLDVEYNIFYLESLEKNKSLKSVELILSEMESLKLNKTDLLLSFGGGIIGDVGGLCASLYMRGIDFIQIPTTTLSQIDSSVGGKVAVNFNHVKNLIGAFLQPQAVLIDPDILESLPQKHINAGLVEALKMGLTSNKKLYDLVLDDNRNDNIEEIILESVKTKAAVVEKDEFDTGYRNILNFGHTFAHAIESYYGYIHGEAVFIGILNGFISEDIKLDLLKLNESFNFDIQVGFNEDIYKLILSDKKLSDERINIVKVKDVGEGYLEKVSLEEIKEQYHE